MGDINVIILFERHKIFHENNEVLLHNMGKNQTGAIHKFCLYENVIEISSTSLKLVGPLCLSFK